MAWFKNWFVAIASAVSLVLLGTLVSQQFELSNQIGQHTEKFNSIEGSFTSLDKTLGTISIEIANSETALAAKLDTLATSLTHLKSSIDVRDVDIGKVLATMGVVENNTAFYAAIYRDHVWVFPSDDVANAKFLARGLSREPINSALAGYKVLSLNAVAKQ